MRFPDLRPSTDWAAIKHKGATIAEVWFKPDGEPWGLILRVPHETFQTPGLAQALSAGKLLQAVTIAPEEVESWRLEGASSSDAVESPHDLAAPLPPPAADRGHLLIHVRLKSGDAAEAGRPGGERESRERLQDLEARWKVLLGLESNIESMRLKMDATRAEMEAAAKRPLSAEEKTHALQADVAQLTRVKNRVPYSLPKAKEFIHRATWMLGAAERKQLEEAFTRLVESQAAMLAFDKLPDQIESMIKDRQNFLAQGTAVDQECRGVIANMQAALRTLQSNASARAKKKR